MARIRSTEDRDYCLGEIKLDRVDVEKDSGILVSHNLRWNNHVDVISSKAQQMLNVLYRTCKDINDIYYYLIEQRNCFILLGFTRP